MILIRDLRLRPGEPMEALKEQAAEKLRVDGRRIESWKLVRRSLDARKKDDIHYVCAVAVALRGSEESALRRIRDKNNGAIGGDQYSDHEDGDE